VLVIRAAFVGRSLAATGQLLAADNPAIRHVSNPRTGSVTKQVLWPLKSVLLVRSPLLL
jgi:hypothetical protein